MWTKCSADNKIKKRRSQPPTSLNPTHAGLACQKTPKQSLSMMITIRIPHSPPSTPHSTLHTANNAHYLCSTASHLLYRGRIPPVLVELPIPKAQQLCHNVQPALPRPPSLSRLTTHSLPFLFLTACYLSTDTFSHLRHHVGCAIHSIRSSQKPHHRWKRQ